MTEKELITQIKKLREIKPAKDWVVLAKSQILGSPAQILPSAEFAAGNELTRKSGISVISFLSGLRFNAVFASILAIFVLIGLFSFAQYSLPGNLLYSVKKATEKGQAVFVSKEEKPRYNLDLTNKRLEELNQIAQYNQVKNIAPALDEFQKTKSVAKKSISKSIKEKSEKEAIEIAKEVAPELNKINKEEERVLSVLGIDSEEKENDSADKSVIELLLKDAEDSTLTEQQAEDLNEVRNYYESGDYAKSLEFYLISSLNYAK